MWVTLEVPHNESGREARSVRGRVTWIQRPRTVRELFQIGVELEVRRKRLGNCLPSAEIGFPSPKPWRVPNSKSPSHPKLKSPHTRLKIGPQQKKHPLPRRQGPSRWRTTFACFHCRLLAIHPCSSRGQVARLVDEAKQQIQNMARESATNAVAAETRPLLAALQAQLNDAGGKIGGRRRHVAHRKVASKKPCNAWSKSGKRAWRPCWRNCRAN